MAFFVIAIVAGLLGGVTASFAGNSGADLAAAPTTRWVESETFSLPVPSAWSELPPTDLEGLRTRFETLIRDVYPQADIVAAPAERVRWLAAFSSADAAASVALAIAEIPPPKENGREYIQSRVLGFADRQRADGVVAKLTPTLTEEMNGVPAVEVIGDLPDGSTLYTLHLWTSVYRDRVTTVAGLVRPDASAADRAAVVQTLESARPGQELAMALQQPTTRQWLRDIFWRPPHVSDSYRVLQQIAVVFITFTVFFYLCLRVLYLATLAWYRLLDMPEEVARLLKVAAGDKLRLGLVYSEKIVMTCALLSMSMTSGTLMWIASA
jgi:hypothetical protein